MDRSGLVSDNSVQKNALLYSVQNNFKSYLKKETVLGCNDGHIESRFRREQRAFEMASATKRLRQFRNRSHFSRDAKRMYEKTYYSHAPSVVSTVTLVIVGMGKRLRAFSPLLCLDGLTHPGICQTRQNEHTSSRNPSVKTHQNEKPAIDENIDPSYRFEQTSNDGNEPRRPGGWNPRITFDRFITRKDIREFSEHCLLKLGKTYAQLVNESGLRGERADPNTTGTMKDHSRLFDMCMDTYFRFEGRSLGPEEAYSHISIVVHFSDRWTDPRVILDKMSDRRQGTLCRKVIWSRDHGPIRYAHRLRKLNMTFQRSLGLDQYEETGSNHHRAIMGNAAMTEMDNMLDNTIDWKKVEELETTIWMAQTDPKCPAFVRKYIFFIELERAKIHNSSLFFLLVKNSVKSYKNILLQALARCKQKADTLKKEANEFYGQTEGMLSSAQIRLNNQTAGHMFRSAFHTVTIAGNAVPGDRVEDGESEHPRDSKIQGTLCLRFFIVSFAVFVYTASNAFDFTALYFIKRIAYGYMGTDRIVNAPWQKLAHFRLLMADTSQEVNLVEKMIQNAEVFIPVEDAQQQRQQKKHSLLTTPNLVRESYRINIMLNDAADFTSDNSDCGLIKCEAQIIGPNCSVVEKPTQVFKLGPATAMKPDPAIGRRIGGLPVQYQDELRLAESVNPTANDISVYARYR
ncbi:hypothetical protein CLF_100873 [Clonorchis sinensis]|uniref:Uncharacterized protein n=1 Tax=Clonorchis sinensis TaxID=79923 RepID=G7Y4G0_CLOSI|nr:hypothetical protein CLF_100873 [Clonorchis sinensis]